MNTPAASLSEVLAANRRGRLCIFPSLGKPWAGATLGVSRSMCQKSSADAFHRISISSRILKSWLVSLIPTFLRTRHLTGLGRGLDLQSPRTHLRGLYGYNEVYTQETSALDFFPNSVKGTAARCPLTTFRPMFRIILKRINQRKNTGSEWVLLKAMVELVILK